MTRPLLVVGWLLVAFDLVIAASLLFGRKTGDAATSAFAPGFGAILLMIGVAGSGLLVWGGRGAGRPGVLVIAAVLVGAPLIFALMLGASPRGVMGRTNLSIGERKSAVGLVPQYLYPDEASRKAANALLMNNYDELDTILRAKPAPDWTARDERGASLISLAITHAVGSSATERDIETLRKVIAAGAKPRADDLGINGSLMDMLARIDGGPASVALGILIDAGLSPNTPMDDGRSVLFHPFLSVHAAQMLIARGAKTDVRESHGRTGDWSPVTYHAQQLRFPTALALLNAGVPGDYGTPPGAALADVMAIASKQATNEQKQAPEYKAFIALVH